MYQITRLFLFVLVATTIACGPTRTSATAQNEITGDQEQGQIFRMNGEEATLFAVDAQGNAMDVVVHTQDHISIIGDEQIADDGQKWIAVVVDRNDDNAATLFYVKEQDVLNLPLELMTIADDSDWSDLEMMRAKKMTYCYKYVKQYLLKIGLVKEYLPGASAYMAATTLPKYGFKKVARKPSQAVTNDVCVYKGGPSGHGHIEIKTSKGWYYGYGYKSAPIQNRIFIGCFHK